jgi:hypothetical protein
MMLKCLFLHHRQLRLKSGVGTVCGLWRALNLTVLRSVEQWGGGDIVHGYPQLVITVVIRRKIGHARYSFQSYLGSISLNPLR